MNTHKAPGPNDSFKKVLADVKARSGIPTAPESPTITDGMKIEAILLLADAHDFEPRRRFDAIRQVAKAEGPLDAIIKPFLPVKGPHFDVIH